MPPAGNALDRSRHRREGALRAALGAVAFGATIALMSATSSDDGPGGGVFGVLALVVMLAAIYSGLAQVVFGLGRADLDRLPLWKKLPLALAFVPFLFLGLILAFALLRV